MMQFAEPWTEGGVAALAVAGLVAGYRLVDRWAHRFFTVSNKQADAVAKLSVGLQQSHSDQREGLIVMRAIAGQGDEMKEQLSQVREKICGIEDEVKSLGASVQGLSGEIHGRA